MRRLAVVLLVLLACRKFATDGAFLDGTTTKSGALIRGRFFHNTTCAANSHGVLRCFSSCNPVIYGMGDDLSTLERAKVPVQACTGIVDEAGNTTVVGDRSLATMHADGSFAVVRAPELRGARHAVGGHGRVAEISETGGLAVFSTDTGARLWTDDGAAVRSIAIRPDGGVVETGRQAKAAIVRAFNPDGTAQWTHTLPGGDIGGVAVGPSGEIAVLAKATGEGVSFGGGKLVGWELAMLESTGEVRWAHGIEVEPQSALVTAELATDGTDIYIAGAGDASAEANGFVARESKDGKVWTTTLVGPSPEPHILALTPTALLLEVPVYPYELDPDKGDPDHATTGVGDAVLKTDGTGKLIARIAR